MSLRVVVCVCVQINFCYLALILRVFGLFALQCLWAHNDCISRKIFPHIRLIIVGSKKYQKGHETRGRKIKNYFLQDHKGISVNTFTTAT